MHDIDKISLFTFIHLLKGYFPQVMRREIKHTSYHIPICILLFFLVGFLYLPTMHNSFVYHDLDYISNNSSIQSVKNIPRLITSYFPTDYRQTYRPVTALSYMMDYLLWKSNPPGYHITNILLHILASMLCYALFWHLTGKDIRAALFASILFTLHPLHVENVAWVSGRAGILGALCIFSAFLLNAAHPEEKGMGFSDKRGGGPDQNRDIFFIFQKEWKIGEKFSVPMNLVLMPVLYLIGMLSWEYCIIFPALLLAYDLIYHRAKYKDSGFLGRRLVGVYAPLMAMLVLYLLIRTGVKASLPVSAEPSSLFKYSKIEKPFAPALFTRYLLLSLLPWRLTLLHVLDAGPAHWMSLVLMLGFFACLVYLYKKIPVACYGLGFFFLSTICLIIVPLDNLLAERMSYLGVAGICLALGTILAFFSRKGISASHSAPGTIIMTIFLCLFGFYGIKSYTRNGEWADGISLWTAESNLHPQSAYAQNNLALNLYSSGMTSQAERIFHKTLEIDPLFFPAYHNLAKLLLDSNRTDEAKKILEMAYDKGTKDDDSNYSNIGLLYLELGQTFPAERSLNKALEINPKNVSALSELGSLAFVNGQYKEAIEYFTKALENLPGEGRSIYLSNRGAAFYKSGNIPKAVEDLEEALRIDPHLANPYLTLASIEGERKFAEKSVALLEEALQKVPNPPFEVYFNLHQLYAQFNQPQKAFDILLEYQKRAPNDIRIQMAIGKYCLNWYENVQPEKGKLQTAATCFKNAHKLDPRNKETLILYGKTAALMGQKDAAEKIWRQALKIDPNDVEVKKLLQDLPKMQNVK